MGCQCDGLIAELKDHLRDLSLARRELKVEQRALELYRKKAARDARLKRYEIAGAVGEVIELVGQVLSLEKEPGAIVAMVGKSIAVVSKIVALVEDTVADTEAEEWAIIAARVDNAVDRVAQSVDRLQHSFTAFWECADPFVPRTVQVTLDGSADVAAGGFRSQSTMTLAATIPLSALKADCADDYRDRLKSWLADDVTTIYRGTVPASAQVSAFRLVGASGIARVIEQSYSVADGGVQVGAAVLWSRKNPSRLTLVGISVSGSQPLRLNAVVEVLGQSQSISTTVELAGQFKEAVLALRLQVGGTRPAVRVSDPGTPWVWERSDAGAGVRRAGRVEVRAG